MNNINNTALITIIVIVVILLIAGFVYWSGGQSGTPTYTTTITNEPPAENTSTSAAPVVPATESTSTGTSSASSVPPLEYTIVAKNYSFTPNKITVAPGDRVRLTVRSEGGTHDLKLDAFNVATKRLSSGESDTIEFVANKTGSFEYYCSVDGHRAMGMTGTLIVGGGE